MKRITALLLLLLFLCSCENATVQTEHAQEEPYLSFLMLDIYQRGDAFVLKLQGGGRVVFSLEGELLESRGVTVVDGSDAVSFVGKSRQELLDAYGSAPCDIASGVERPTYITKQCTLLSYTLLGDEVRDLTITNILTKETQHFESVSALDRSLSLVIEDGRVKEGGDWRWFLSSSGGVTACEISISKSYDGVTYLSTLLYDEGIYTITDEDGARSYPYLLYSGESLPQGAIDNFAEYFLLSDDPEMTADRYFSHMLSSQFQPDFPRTEIVYTDYLRFDRAETYGAVPAKYTKQENLSLLHFADFCAEGFYQSVVTAVSDSASSDSSETLRKCYSYDFEALADNSLPTAQGKGVYLGQARDYDDPIFSPKEADRLPAFEDEYGICRVYAGGIWQEGETYILLRYHKLAPWKLQNPLISYQSTYCELILTCYDKDGHPLWQTTSDIFVK